MGIAIAPGYLEALQKERRLSDVAFMCACGVSEKRLAELKNGEEPSPNEFQKIVIGFNLTDGIPMVPRSQKLVA